MNDLQQNRLIRLERQMEILRQQLITTNRDLMSMHDDLADLLSEVIDSAQWHRRKAVIEGRLAALNSLKPRQ